MGILPLASSLPDPIRKVWKRRQGSLSHHLQIDEQTNVEIGCTNLEQDADSIVHLYVRILKGSHASQIVILHATERARLLESSLETPERVSKGKRRYHILE
jgi:hypothetical protein